MSIERKSDTKYSRVVCSNPKGMTTTTSKKSRDKETHFSETVLIDMMIEETCNMIDKDCLIL